MALKERNPFNQQIVRGDGWIYCFVLICQRISKFLRNILRTWSRFPVTAVHDPPCAKRGRERKRERERALLLLLLLLRPFPPLIPKSQPKTLCTADSSHHLSPRIMETELKQLWYVRLWYFSALVVSSSVCLTWFSSLLNNFFFSWCFCFRQTQLQK